MTLEVEGKGAMTYKVGETFSVARPARFTKG